MMRSLAGIYENVEDPDAPLSTKDVWTSPAEQKKTIAAFVGAISISLAASTLAVAKFTNLGKTVQERCVQGLLCLRSMSQSCSF